VVVIRRCANSLSCEEFNLKTTTAVDFRSRRILNCFAL
jgi:hypothetical protein